MPDPFTVLLLVVCLAFTVVNGVNDGAALVATGLKVRAMPPWVAALLVAAALVIVPLVIGTAVATTLVDGLVDFTDQMATIGIGLAVLVTMGVVGALTRIGLPTSLTLALVGGIAGAGLGLGQPVAWGAVARVVAIGIAAPVLGGLLGWGLSRALRLAPRGGSATRRIAGAHWAGFGAQCVAYAANDGQKMVAVVAVATGGAAATGGIDPSAGLLAGLAALFVVGLVLGLPAVAGTLSDAVVAVRPATAVTAELAAAAASLGSAALGVPVSMTQATAGGLVGAGVSDDYRKVRWRVAAQLALAWVVTLPASLAIAWAVALAFGASR